MAENNTEVTKVAINDIGTEEDFIKAVDSTIKNFDDGDLVEGTVVKIDHDEVLLDIGYKTEGVIPSRELSIKKDELYLTARMKTHALLGMLSEWVQNGMHDDYMIYFEQMRTILERETVPSRTFQKKTKIRSA